MSVLQRKAQAGKQVHQARSMTVPKALRVALAKEADDLLDVALVVIGAKQERCDADALSDVIDENELLVLLDGPAGMTGGMALGAGLVTALVQQQTIGRVSAPSEDARRLTATDAALCAPLIDALFSRAHGLLETEPDRMIINRFKFGARAENKRLFDLALGEPEYNLIHLTIDVAAGTLQSTMTLVLPVREVASDPVETEETGAADLPRKTLEPTIMAIEAELSAVLCEVKLPLAKLSALSPGDVLSVPPEAFDRINLFSLEGRCVAKGALGQVDGRRALMIMKSASRMQASGEGRLEDGFDGPPEVDLQTPPFETPDEAGGMLPMDDLPAMQADETVAELPELPDLPDLPDLDDIGAEDEDQALPDLPDLPDFPDLDGDLPDLGELPKLNIA